LHTPDIFEWDSLDLNETVGYSSFEMECDKKKQVFMAGTVKRKFWIKTLFNNSMLIYVNNKEKNISKIFWYLLFYVNFMINYVINRRKKLK
jgi:hypothetical protein